MRRVVRLGAVHRNAVRAGTNSSHTLPLRTAGAGWVVPRGGAVWLDSGRSFGTSAPGSGADKQLLDMMTASAHWKIDGSGFLSKKYEFRDDKAARLFVARAADLWPKLCCPAQDLELSARTVSLVVKDASALGGEVSEVPGGEPAFAREPTAVEVDIALAVDDVAAELQLGGRWN